MRRYIANGLCEYLKEFHGVWHMPGHKRKNGDFLRSKGENPNLSMIDTVLDNLHNIDVTEVPGLDDLHNPMGIIYESEKELASVYGTFASYYLVNGSTGGILAAVASCVSQKGKIIVADNCHKSVHNIACLLKLDACYVKSEALFENAGEAIKTICNDNPEAKAVVVTSPTYEGVFLDINIISEIVHNAGMKLIVDEAHGAHLPFIKSLKKYSAIYNGADVVIQSLHKTLPSMTQTAILHVMDENLDADIRRYLSVFMSSSPSYIMLCDMERAIDIAQNYNYEAYMTKLMATRKKLLELKNITLKEVRKNFDMEKLNSDPTRLVLSAKAPITGAGFEKLLSDEYGIVCEMSGIDYVVLISTFFDSDEDFDYLYNSLKKIDDNYDNYIKKIKDIENETDQVYTFNANCSDKAYIKEMIGTLNALEGEAAKDNIYVYPPGIYIVKKGEVYTRKKLDELILHVRQGRQLLGELN